MPPFGVFEVSLGALACALVGAWAGASGYSGWPFVVPALHGVLGLPPFESVLASLLLDWSAALAASVVYVRDGAADSDVALHWGLASVPIVAAGAAVSLVLVPSRGALLGAASGPVGVLLGAALIARAVRLRDPAAEPGDAAARHPTIEDASRVAPLALVGWRATTYRAGMVGGSLLIGLVGMGGGFAIAMLQVLFRGRPMRSGVATGLLFSVFALPCALLAYGAVADLPEGHWRLLLTACGVVAIAAALGARSVARLAPRAMATTVGLCVLSAGVAAMLQRIALH